MAVIINEVEVVVEQAAPPTAAPGAAPAPAAPALQPLDLAAILARQTRIQRRLAAH